MTNWTFMNLFPDVKSLEETVKYNSIESHPELVGLNSPEEVQRKVGAFLLTPLSRFPNENFVRYQELSLERISSELGEDYFDSFVKEAKEDYNFFIDETSLNYPKTLDSLWQVFRRSLILGDLPNSKRSGSFQEEDEFLSRNCRSLYESLYACFSENIPESLGRSIKSFIPLSQEPDYALSSAQEHPHLKKAVYNFNIPGFGTYSTMWDLRQETIPKFNLANPVVNRDFTLL